LGWSLLLLATTVTSRCFVCVGFGVVAGPIRASASGEGRDLGKSDGIGHFLTANLGEDGHGVHDFTNGGTIEFVGVEEVGGTRDTYVGQDRGVVHKQLLSTKKRRIRIARVGTSNTEQKTRKCGGW